MTAIQVFFCLTAIGCQSPNNKCPFYWHYMEGRRMEEQRVSNGIATIRYPRKRVSSGWECEFRNCRDRAKKHSIVPVTRVCSSFLLSVSLFSSPSFQIRISLPSLPVRFRNAYISSIGQWTSLEPFTKIIMHSLVIFQFFTATYQNYYEGELTLTHISYGS